MEWRTFSPIFDRSIVENPQDGDFYLILGYQSEKFRRRWTYIQATGRLATRGWGGAGHGRTAMAWLWATELPAAGRSRGSRPQPSDRRGRCTCTQHQLPALAPRIRGQSRSG